MDDHQTDSLQHLHPNGAPDVHPDQVSSPQTIKETRPRGLSFTEQRELRKNEREEKDEEESEQRKRRHREAWEKVSSLSSSSSPLHRCQSLLACTSVAVSDCIGGCVCACALPIIRGASLSVSL